MYNKKQKEIEELVLKEINAEAKRLEELAKKLLNNSMTKKACFENLTEGYMNLKEFCFLKTRKISKTQSLWYDSYDDCKNTLAWIEELGNRDTGITEKEFLDLEFL